MVTTKDDGALLEATKCRYRPMGMGLRLQHLFILLTVFVIVMGLLSRSYLDPSSRSLTNIEILRNYEPGRPLEISEEDSVARPSSTRKRVTSGEAVQNGEPRIEQHRREPQTKIEKNYENPIKEESEEEDGLPMPSANEKRSTNQEKENVTSVIDEDHGHLQHHVKEILMAPEVQVKMQQQVEETSPTDNPTTKLSGIEVTPMEQEEPIERLPDRDQKRNTGEYKETVDSNERQNRLPGQMIIQPSSDSLEEPPNLSRSRGECDVTEGKWVHDLAGPLYHFDQCSILSRPQNCQRNGRPDHGYESYRWEPDRCSLPRFDPNEFLELMRGKTLAFIGDSLARNQMESLMCILLQASAAVNKGRKDMQRWYFRSHKFTVIRIWSSWLVQADGDFPPSIAPPDTHNLNLTELDSYAQHLPHFDVTILSSGHWWVRRLAFFMEGKIVGGNWPRSPSSGVVEMDTKMAFGTAMNNTLRKVGSYPGYKGLTILRTYLPDHYKGGSWDTGGSCTGETQPYTEGPKNDFNEQMHEVQLKAFNSNAPKSKDGVMPNGSKLRLLDVYPILNYRGDGHPGPYRNTNPDKQTTRDSQGRLPPQDCLHWCMPGPVDTMNELLFDLIRKEMQ